MNLEEFTNECWRWAQAYVEETGYDLGVTFMGLDREGRRHFIGVRDYAEDKRAAKVLLRAYCFKHEIAMYAIASSAWMRIATNTEKKDPNAFIEEATKVMPSAAPDRIDALTLSGRSKDCMVLMTARVVKVGDKTKVVPIDNHPSLVHKRGEPDFEERIDMSPLHHITNFDYSTVRNPEEMRKLIKPSIFKLAFGSIRVFEAHEFTPDHSRN
jgi:hypothetical protein